MNFRLVVFVMGSLSVAHCAELSSMNVAQLAHCRIGYKGERNHDRYHTFNSCKNEQLKNHWTDECHTVCLWERANYFLKNGEGKAIGINKTAVSLVSQEFFAPGQSADGYANDVIKCAEIVKPLPNIVNDGKCKEFEPINTCHKENLLNHCLDFLHSSGDD